jgi:FkbM family methyltransferase
MQALKNKFRGLQEIFYFDNWFQLLINNTLFRKQPLQVYRKGKMNLISNKSKGDVMGLRSVIASPMYRVFLSEMKLPAEISLLDIGANVGGFALMLQLNGHKPVRYTGVEMHPQTFSRLSVNLLHNLGGQPQLLNKAVYNENGTIKVSFTGGGTGESVSDIKGAGETTLQTITLNSLVEENFNGQEIDICKMDIEGSEYDIFFGNSANRIKDARFLLIEIHPNEKYTNEQLIGVINNHGFALTKQFEDVYLFKNTRRD